MYTDLLLSGVPIEQLDMAHSDQGRNTALHLACLQGHEECAIAILEKCSDDLIHVTNAVGKTYEFVCVCVCVCIIKLLFVCYSPLHIAAKSGLVGVVKELINRGADLNIRDADGMS